MSPKSNHRNWNDIQIAIATTAIVATLGLWNLFATPAKTVTAQAADEPVIPPTPTEPPIEIEPTAMAMPQVKIMFTQTAPQTVSNPQQPQNNNQNNKKKKKNNNNNNNNNGGGGTVTNTKTS